MEESDTVQQDNELFMANTVHEIRTPVQTIIGTLELLSDTNLNNEQTEYVRQIRFGADVLLTLVNDILDFSKIRSNKFSLENIPFDVIRLTDQVVYLVSIEAFNKKLEIVTDIDYSLPPLIMGDPTRVQQILLNIIKNAVKFTNRGYIHVELSKKDEKTILFQITDSGIGIPENGRAKLFSNYYQGDASTSRKYGGTGLGLSICRGLVNTMHGEIGVKPNPYGGSIFWFTLPLVPAANPEPHTFELPVPATTHIMIVDDSRLAADSLKKKLNSLGLQYIQQAATAKEALLSMEYAVKLGTPFNIVFIDMVMPIVDGWHLASDIKNNPLISNAKLYMLVPEGQMGKEAKMKLLNWFTGYLYKPVKRDKLDSLLIETNGSIPSAALLDMIQEQKPEEKKTEADSCPAEGLKILVAEDHSMNRKILVTFLQKYGAEVIEAEDGEAAVRQVRKNPNIQIVFMDIQMPVMDGLEAAMALRKQKYAGIIIACTANNDQSNFIEYRETGVNDLLIKPFKREAVKALIDKWKTVINLPAAMEIAVLDVDISMNSSLWDSSDFEDTIGNDRDLGEQLLLDYSGQTQKLLDSAEKMIKKSNLTELNRIGHTLKGSSAAISAGRLSAAGAKLEKAAQKADTAGIKKSLAEFREQFEIFLIAAEKWKRGK